MVRISANNSEYQGVGMWKYDYEHSEFLLDAILVNVVEADEQYYEDDDEDDWNRGRWWKINVIDLLRFYY